MSQTENKTLRAALVGCGGMGRNQARILSRMAEYELSAVCDINPDNLKKTADDTGATPYSDFADCLATERPQIVAVPSDNRSHAKLTIMAAETESVLGIYTEKPMAVSMGEARAMVDACERNGVKLVINHQRRIGPDMVRMRELIEQDAIGTLRRVRVQCAGDVLSDGTHAMDSALHLCGDRDVEWVFGALHREIDEDMIEKARKQSARSGKTAQPGYRFGHPVENGATAVFQIHDGPRVEMFCGDMREEFRIYQDYEVFGDRGRLWRTGDRFDPNLFIQDAQGGSWQIGVESWNLKPVPGDTTTYEGWRPVEVESRKGKNGIEEGYRRLAEWVYNGRPHEMCAENALRGFEVIMAVYESARLHRRIHLPLRQDEFALQLMLDSGELQDAEEVLNA